MTAQTGAVSEGLATQLTNERFHVKVFVHVTLIVTVLHETFPAQITDMAEVASMLPHVVIVPGLCRKRLQAHWASGHVVFGRRDAGECISSQLYRQVSC